MAIMLQNSKIPPRLPLTAQGHQPPFSLIFTHRDCLIGLAVVLLAFAFRLLILVNRAQSPVVGAFDPLPEGTDQRVYYESIAHYHDGSYPPTRYFFQPGMPWFLIAASTLLRTDNPGALRVLIAWLASVNCGLLIAITRLAFGRRWIAVLAGVLLALYPVSAFYDTDFVITSQAAEFVSVALFGALWLWRAPRQWTGALLIGVSFGLLALFRFELLALAPIVIGWLVWMRRDRAILLQMALAVVIGVGLVLPTMLHNRAGGADYLITPVGSAEIYRGNSRDADGTYSTPLASQTTGGDYLHFLANDIGLSPRRFIELELHKIGLYVSRNEPGNDLSYVQSGADAAPILRADPLDFRLLSGMFMFGLFSLFVTRKQSASSFMPLTVFVLAFLAMMGSTLLIWVEARIRTPVVIVLIPVAAYGVGYTIELIRKREHWLELRAPLLALAGIGLLLGIAGVFESSLPRPLTASDLPADAQRVIGLYDQTLELAGWRIEDQYSPTGTIAPFQPYVVSLYWRVVRPTTIDYSFSLAYFLDGQRLLGVDHPIGTISYPAAPTSQWKPGNLHVERVALSYKSFDAPLLISGDVFLSVYRDRDAAHLLSVANISGSSDHIRLARPAIVWGAGQFAPELPRNLSAVNFGDALTLKSWLFATSATPAQNVPILLGWQTGTQPITRPYTIVVFALDSAGKVAAQIDSPPRNGRLLTTSLPINYALTDSLNLSAPAATGSYQLMLGVYDSDTIVRLPSMSAGGTNAAETLTLLGTLTVQPR